MLQIVDALRAIHGQNIVHRDLKPENIMVSERRGRPHYVKLLDFGLAITPAQSRLTVSGVVIGTVRYLPPERISDGISSPAGDIYSAGIILYEMLTGSKPFWSEATGEVIHRILETYPLPVRVINPAIPTGAGGADPGHDRQGPGPAAAAGRGRDGTAAPGSRLSGGRREDWSQSGPITFRLICSRSEHV